MWTRTLKRGQLEDSRIPWGLLCSYSNRDPQLSLQVGDGSLVQSREKPFCCFAAEVKRDVMSKLTGSSCFFPIAPAPPYGHFIQLVQGPAAPSRPGFTPRARSPPASELSSASKFSLPVQGTAPACTPPLSHPLGEMGIARVRAAGSGASPSLLLLDRSQGERNGCPSFLATQLSGG